MGQVWFGEFNLAGHALFVCLFLVIVVGEIDFSRCKVLIVKIKNRITPGIE